MSSGAAARRSIALIDLTDLADDHAPDGIDALCARASEHGVAAVCVWPEYVGRCRELLGAVGETAVGIATVVNFPSGAESTDDVVVAAVQAVADGATEIDVVLPYGRVLSGDDAGAAATIAAVAAASRVAGHAAGRDVHVKAILETGELPDAQTIKRAAQLAVDAGVDFIKTSTGKTAVGATPEAVAAMVEVIADADRTIGLKPSGGIRTPTEAAALIEIAEARLGAGWATPDTFRFGASSLLDALLAELD